MCRVLTNLAYGCQFAQTAMVAGFERKLRPAEVGPGGAEGAIDSTVSREDVIGCLAALVIDRGGGLASRLSAPGLANVQAAGAALSHCQLVYQPP